jgi:hypothetical protein
MPTLAGGGVIGLVEGTLRFRGHARMRGHQASSIPHAFGCRAKSKTLSNFEKSFLFFAMKSDISLLTEKLVAVMDTASIRQEITEQLQIVTKF